jgi:magnesium-transporting ATPase (P-type)
VFENKLKPETVPAMRVLREAGISIVIITGDNPLTGANIGFKAGVIDKHLNVMIIDTAPNNKLIVKNFFEQNKSDLETTDASEGYIHELQPKIKSEQDFECTVEELPSLAIQIGKKGSCVFCITGTAFASVFDT